MFPLRLQMIIVNGFVTRLLPNMSTSLQSISIRFGTGYPLITPSISLTQDIRRSKKSFQTNSLFLAKPDGLQQASHKAWHFLAPQIRHVTSRILSLGRKRIMCLIIILMRLMKAGKPVRAELAPTGGSISKMGRSNRSEERRVGKE